MKNVKQKLFGATTMLVISALMLTTASYAWFTISTNPEITGISATMQANQNLEIALKDDAVATAPDNFIDTDASGQSGNNLVWGNLVDLSAYFTTAEDLFPAYMAKTDNLVNGTIMYPEYGTDGRVADFAAATKDTALLNAAENGAVYYIRDTGGKAVGIQVDFWMKSNIGGDVVLTEAIGRAEGSDLDEGGAGSTLSVNDDPYEHIKVVFISETSTTVYSTIDSTALEAEDGTGIVAILAVNVAQPVTMYIYWDGETVTNEAELIDDAMELLINIQFALNNVTLVPINGAGS